MAGTFTLEVPDVPDAERPRPGERAEPDERMPAHYKLAGIRTVVMFNTTPEPA